MYAVFQSENRKEEKRLKAMDKKGRTTTFFYQADRLEFSGIERSRNIKYSVGHKLGRNKPCRCNSGKKYKHCCLDTSRTIYNALPIKVEEEGNVIFDPKKHTQ